MAMNYLRQKCGANRQPLAATGLSVAMLLLPVAAACDSTPYPTGENFTTTVQSPPDGAAEKLPNSSHSPVVVDIDITEATVRPMNARLIAEVGQRIVLRVDSDSIGAIQVDAESDHSYTVAPKDNQIFSFTAGDPGTVTIGLRDRAHTIATIDVRG
jgi:hypothetical protein